MSPKKSYHFFADFTFAANEVPRRVENRLESEHQLIEEAGLCVLKDLDPLQSVQVHVDTDLGSEFVR